MDGGMEAMSLIDRVEDFDFLGLYSVSLVARNGKRWCGHIKQLVYSACCYIQRNK